MESNNSSVQECHFDSTILIAAGYDPYHLTNQAVAAAARISGSFPSVYLASVHSSHKLTGSDHMILWGAFAQD